MGLGRSEVNWATTLDFGPCPTSRPVFIRVTSGGVSRQVPELRREVPPRGRGTALRPRDQEVASGASLTFE